MVDNAIKENRRLWKEWNAGGSKESYLDSKTKTKSEVSIAERFPNILRW